MIARRLALAFVMSLAALGSASAQQWPTRPLKIVVTFPPGGASDAAARVISGPLPEKLGQTVVIEAELGLSMEHIGYRGAAPMFQDMMAGQLDFAVVTLTEVLPLAKDGKLRMIALTSTEKAPSAPDVPLVTELGYPKLVAENFVGISAAAGFPPAAQARQHKAMAEVLADPRIVERLGDLGFVTKAMTPAEFAAFVAAQVQTFQAPVKASGAKL